MSVQGLFRIMVCCVWLQAKLSDSICRDAIGVSDMSHRLGGAAGQRLSGRRDNNNGWRGSRGGLGLSCRRGQSQAGDSQNCTTRDQAGTCAI
jgi:hypothetical protein